MYKPVCKFVTLLGGHDVCDHDDTCMSMMSDPVSVMVCVIMMIHVCP